MTKDYLVPLPYQRMPEGWGETFEVLERGGLDSSVQWATPADELLGYAAIGVFGLALHRCYQLKWDSKHKVPTRSKKLKAEIEPLGVLLRAAVELCIQTHPFRGNAAVQYRDAADWFCPVAFELRDFCCSGASSKQALIHRLREASRILDEDENPFDRSAMPALSGLVDDAIAIARANDRFFKEYWRGLKKIRPKDNRSRGFRYALAAWTSRLNTSPALTNLQPAGHKVMSVGRAGHLEDVTEYLKDSDP